MVETKKEKPVSSRIYDEKYYKSANPGYERFKDGFKLKEGYEEKFERVDFVGKSVLDIGCGRGEFLYYSALKGADVIVGIDYSVDAVNIVKQQVIPSLDKRLKRKVEVFEMNAKKLEFPNCSFDIVAVFDVVEHLHDWELKKCIIEISRVLKPGGKVLVHTSPNKYNMDVVRFFIKPFGIKLKSEPFHVNEQSYFSMRRYFSDFDGYTLLEKDKNYWSNQVEDRGKNIRKIAKILDTVSDFPIAHKILSLFPLSLLFGTDIWFDGKKPQV